MMLFVSVNLALIISFIVTPSYTYSVGAYTDYGSGTMTTGRQVIYASQVNIPGLFEFNFACWTIFFFAIGLFYSMVSQKRV